KEKAPVLRREAFPQPWCFEPCCSLHHVGRGRSARRHQASNSTWPANTDPSARLRHRSRTIKSSRVFVDVRVGELEGAGVGANRNPAAQVGGYLDNVA